MKWERLAGRAAIGKDRTGLDTQLSAHAMEVSQCIAAAFGRSQGTNAKSLLPTYPTIAVSIGNKPTQKRQS